MEAPFGFILCLKYNMLRFGPSWEVKAVINIAKLTKIERLHYLRLR